MPRVKDKAKQEARQLGLKTYEGPLCENDHNENGYSIRYSKSGACVKCAALYFKEHQPIIAERQRYRYLEDEDFVIAQHGARAKHRSGYNYAQHKGVQCEHCSFIPVDMCQLTVDHIDGDRYNNDLSNLQTLCHNCHAIKTKMTPRVKRSKSSNPSSLGE